jgi:hypothetical protein
MAVRGVTPKTAGPCAHGLDLGIDVLIAVNHSVVSLMRGAGSVD